MAVVQTVQKSIGSADKVYELLTSTKPGHIASYSFGKPAAFLKAAEKVGLIDSLNKHIDRKHIDGLTPAEYLLLIIIGGKSMHIAGMCSMNILIKVHFNLSGIPNTNCQVKTFLII